MECIGDVDRSSLEGKQAIAVSDQFAIYAVGADTYLLVQRHEGTPWTGVRISGDGLFRVGALIVDAMRHLYRDVAAELSPVRQRTQPGHPTTERSRTGAVSSPDDRPH
jgi:hypothetical protein